MTFLSLNHNPHFEIDTKSIVNVSPTKQSPKSYLNNENFPTNVALYGRSKIAPNDSHFYIMKGRDALNGRIEVTQKSVDKETSTLIENKT